MDELDSLRGIGALLILAFHLWPSTFFFGWARVDLFFVLSGYLITSIILRHGSRPRFLLTFWARRAFRIWPAYFLLLAIITCRGIAEGVPPRLDSLFAHLTFTQNLPHYWSETVPPFPRAAQQTWSLAIEEQFYLLWPMIVVFAGRSWVIPAAIWLAINSVGARMMGLYPAVALARSDGLAIGAILAATLAGGRGSRWLSPALALIGLAAVCFLASPAARREAPIAGIPDCGPLSILVVNFLYLSLIGLTVLHAGHPLLRPLRFRALRYLGRISYGVFLYHLLVIEAVGDRLGPRSLANDLAAGLLSLLAAAISWEYLERPIAGLKSAFQYEIRSSTDMKPGRRDRRVWMPGDWARSWGFKGVLGLLGLGVLTIFPDRRSGLSSGVEHGFLDRVFVSPLGEATKYGMFVPQDYRGDAPYPLIVFLHGSGAIGDDGRRPLVAGLGPAIRRRELTFPFLAIFPQTRLGSWRGNSPDTARLLAILDEVGRRFNVDPRRIYLTGMSLGGHGVWELAAATPGRWAAVVPVCGWGDPKAAGRVASLPCWCFHGEEDRVVDVAGSREMVKALRAAGGSPRYTEFLGLGHECWSRVYEDEELYGWLLEQRRGDPQVTKGVGIHHE